MAISWNEEAKTLEDFIEEDLPFLLESHYEATISAVKKQLQSINLSLELILAEHPNFLTKLQYQLFFLFAHHMNTRELKRDHNLHEHYFAIATAYRHEYMDSFVKKQILQAIKLK